MGKWDQTAKTLPKLPDKEQPARRGALNAFKDSLTAAERDDPSALGARFLHLTHERDDLEAELSRVNLHRQAVGELFQAAAEAKKFQSHKLASGASVRVEHAPQGQYVKAWCLGCALDVSEDPQHADECEFTWCPDCGATPSLAQRRQALAQGRTACCAADTPWVSGPGLVVTGQEAFRLHCLRRPELVPDMVLPWGTMNAMLKAALEGGMPPPPGVKAFDLVQTKPWGIAKHPRPIRPGYLENLAQLQRTPPAPGGGDPEES